jgi:hypothetical protein
MLTISFGSRTDSTYDPLVERALLLATEFMDLSGIFPLLTWTGQTPDQGLSKVHYRTLLTSLNRFSGSPLPRDHVPVGSMMGSWKSTAL